MAGPNWTELVARIRTDDQSGMEELYRVFARGVRFYLCRQLGPQEDLDDKVRNTFQIVTHAVRCGELREPERLMGLVRTVLRRQVVAHINQLPQHRRQQVRIGSSTTVVALNCAPEDTASRQQQEEIARTVLNGFSKRDREILKRFYLREQSQQQICAEMNVTEAQFRLLRSQARAQFGEPGKRRPDQRDTG